MMCTSATTISQNIFIDTFVIKYETLKKYIVMGTCHIASNTA